jgi:hypothetical protein
MGQPHQKSAKINKRINYSGYSSDIMVLKAGTI